MSISNKVKKDLDFTNKSERLLLKNNLIAKINEKHDNDVEDGVINFMNQSLGSDGDFDSELKIQSLYTSNRNNQKSIDKSEST